MLVYPPHHGPFCANGSMARVSFRAAIVGRSINVSCQSDGIPNPMQVLSCPHGLGTAYKHPKSDRKIVVKRGIRLCLDSIFLPST